MNLLVEWLKFEEGFRAEPYKDTEGVLTVGYGRNLVAHPMPGRNFQKKPYTEEEGELWLREELGKIVKGLRAREPAWSSLDPVRAGAVVVMAYQLGLAGVSNFHRMWDCLEGGAFVAAARASLNSRWAKQTPNRARRVAEALETGQWPTEISGV